MRIILRRELRRPSGASIAIFWSLYRQLTGEGSGKVPARYGVRRVFTFLLSKSLLAAFLASLAAFFPLPKLQGLNGVELSVAEGLLFWPRYLPLCSIIRSCPSSFPSSP